MIIEEGSAGEDVYFILSGKVKVIKKFDSETLELCALGPDDFFGEIGLFLQTPRSATVEAIEDAEIAIYDRSSFIESIKEDPDKALNIITVLSKRILTAHKIISRLEGEKSSYTTFLYSKL